MTDCKNCLHVAVCARYSATGGMVRKCQHFAEDINVPNWIPVTERLPENDANYLVYRPSMKVKVMVSYYFNGWCEGCMDIRGREVITHWMPIPTLPEGRKYG